MPNLRDLFKDRELYHVTPSLAVADAARYMSERNVGAVCVLEQNRLVGIFSERDMMKRVIAVHRDPGSTRVAEVMTAKPVVVSIQESCETCLKVMKQAGIRHLPVVDGDKLVGLVSLRDLLQVDLSEKVDQLKLMEDYIHYVPPSKPRL
ncbi:MAG: CBS domain-containing protein [Acidobacteria bacterium]|nr:CBS domain-containing protein [Acidobacteriota bacterium]